MEGTRLPVMLVHSTPPWGEPGGGGEPTYLSGQRDDL
jgi:hypothetical protein